MPTTTYRILGNPTNTLPYTISNGTVTSFNQSTGEYIWTPNTNYAGTAVEFTIEGLCDGVVLPTPFNNATQTITVNPPTAVLNITNSTGGSPNLTPVCGSGNIYKANFVWTPASVISPITYQWTLVGNPGRYATTTSTTADFVTVDVTNPPFSTPNIGPVVLQVVANTPFGSYTQSITIDAVCGSVVSDNLTTPINTPITFNPTLNDISCS
jgi:hypothetical protein